MSQVKVFVTDRGTDGRMSFKDCPGCLFTRTFLLKSSYTLLNMLECLKMHASPFNKFNMWYFYGNIKLSLKLHIYLW